MIPNHPERSRNPLKPWLLATSFAIAVAVTANVARAAEPEPTAKPAEQPPPAPADPKEVKLPGLTVNPKDRCVDVEATISLREGSLELIACTKDTKEHESIVTVAARPVHIHTALLLLGARPGNPAMRKALDDEGTRWVDLPPRGGPVDVFLVLKDAEGKAVERPISDFITRSEEDAGNVPEQAPGNDPAAAAKAAKFPTHTFLFAGSHLQGEGPGPRNYLCDHTGNVISLVTFGDELLCLPEVHSQDNGLLMWQADPANLPAVGTKVILRLRPQAPPKDGQQPK